MVPVYEREALVQEEESHEMALQCLIAVFYVLGFGFAFVTPGEFPA